MDENHLSLEAMALWLACDTIQQNTGQYTTAQIYNAYIQIAKDQMLALLEAPARQDN